MKGRDTWKQQILDVGAAYKEHLGIRVIVKMMVDYDAKSASNPPYNIAKTLDVGWIRRFLP